MNAPALLGLGTARPPHAVPQAGAARVAAACCASDARQARLVHRLYSATTVHSRRSVLLSSIDGNDQGEAAAETMHRFFPPRDQSERGPTTAQRMAWFGEHAPPLAAEASVAAMKDADCAADQVTHLVTVTCTGFVSPGVEHELIRRLGLRRTVQRVQIGFMGCHAALNGLQVACSISRAHPDARVLLCCVELCSLHFQYGWHPQQMVANALFSDGAAAALVGCTERAGRPRITAHASNLIPESAGEMTWTIGDHGFEMTLSPRVPEILAQHLRPWLDEWLAKQGLSVAGVSSWCIHAGGPRIVQAVASRIGRTGRNGAATDGSQAVLRECGNMSSATVLFILKQLLEAGGTLPCVMLSFGPGLCAEAALLRA